MIGGIVEIAETGRRLSVHRGFLKVSDDGAELGRVPLDDVTALLLTSPQAILTKAVLVELAERKAIVIACGRNWHPLSITFPFDAHFESARVLSDQIDASEPLKKRLWQRLVRAKIENQATVLGWRDPAHGKRDDLCVLARRVKSGDPENMEAQAARRYWTALMGTQFRRDRFASGPNACLNYGYTVLRAATARAVCAAGLHPSLGLHHDSRANAFALVDDLMEPFRPLVDATVRELVDEYGEETVGDLDPERKRRLAAVLQLDLISERGASPVVNCLRRLARSSASSLAEKKSALELPTLRRPDRLV